MNFTIEINNPALTEIGVAAIKDFYHSLSVAKFQHNEVFAFATGVSSPFLNVVMDARPHAKTSTATINLIKVFFEKHAVPWAWFVIGDTTANDMTSHEFYLLEEAPALYFDLSQPLPVFQNDLIRIEEVDQQDDLKKWSEPIREGFHAAENDDSYRELNAKILNSGSKKFRHFIAFYKNKLAGASTLFLSENCVMLHNLATKTALTKRGVGTALTLHMMAEARQIAYQHCFLDSSEDGFNLYKKLGFMVYSRTLIYARP
jgi:N-acetylglutamate synthase-like GNAT family acetyltransferase